jgi:small ligand-binding sensory domain FIST
MSDGSGPPSLELLDIDPELLLSAIEQLPAKDQARARQTCKLFAIIVDEIARVTSFMCSSVAPCSQVLDQLAPKLESRPTMGILFSKDAQDESSSAPLARLARRLPYHLELVGGHTVVVAGTDGAGTLTQTTSACPHARQHEADVGLMLGSFPEAVCKSFAIDETVNRASSPAENWKAQLEEQGALAQGWKVIVLFSRDDQTTSIVEYLQTVHPGAAIIGGICPGEHLYRIRHQSIDFIEHGLVGLMFKGNVPLAAFVSRGCRPLGGAGAPPVTFGTDDVHSRTTRGGGSVQLLSHVTDAEGKRVTALEAAVERIQSDDSEHNGLFFGVADDAALGFDLVPLDGRTVVQSEGALVLPDRHPARTDGGGGGGAGEPAGGEEEGEEGEGDDVQEAPAWSKGAIQFYSFNADSCKEDLSHRLAAVKKEADSKGDRLLGSIMFTCGARTHHFFGEAAFDASTFCKTFDQTPLIGCYAGGEIGPPLLADAPPSKLFQVGGATVHGFTAVFGMFIVPQRQPRATELAFADADAVAAAYEELRSRADPVPPLESSPPSIRELLPSSLAELRALPVRALKQAMERLGLMLTPGLEKEDIVQAIAPHVGAVADRTEAGASVSSSDFRFDFHAE